MQQQKPLIFIYNLIVGKNILAAIDVGTNTFRLLIAEVLHTGSHCSYSFNEIISERIITRLGDGVQKEGLLKESAINTSIKALKKFSTLISDNNVCMNSAIATSALREAKNSAIFLDRAKAEAGIEIKIISGKREAEMTASGMLIDMPIPESALMIDIGGGSTEMILMKDNDLLSSASLNLGVVYLANKYMLEDPPLSGDLSGMDQEVSRTIQSAIDSFREFITSDTTLIGTAGTVTTLSAVSQNLKCFDHNMIHNSKLSIDKVNAIYSDISVISSKKRADYIPYERERLDIIVPGTLILLKLMEAFKFNTLNVSNYGLREGILIELFKECKC
jgi:exopolyphosphatase/guanosine-5'-triphosphate,3'-diphosphate pyrophosphatase